MRKYDTKYLQVWKYSAIFASKQHNNGKKPADEMSND